MSAAELKRLKGLGGMWCFVDGQRVRRARRIKELEAKAKNKKGRSETNAEARNTEGDPT